MHILTNGSHFPRAYYGYPKLEKGTIATDWSPAPEDTEAKITTINNSIEFINNQLSAKLDRTDIEPINNKITDYGLALDASAESIRLLQDKTELHDDDITAWSNLTESTAEEVGRVMTRVSDTEAGIEQAEADIRSNADGINGLWTKVGQTDDEVESLSTDLSIEAGRIEALLTRTANNETAIGTFQATADGLSADFANYQSDFGSDMNAIEAQVASYEASVSGFRSEVGTLQGSIDDVDDWIIQNGSSIEQTVQGFESKVWMGDVANIGANLIPLTTAAWEDGGYWIANGQPAPTASSARLRETINVIEGDTYTISDYSAYVSAINTIYLYEYRDDIFIGYRSLSRGGRRTFTARGNQVKATLTAVSGFNVRPEFVDHPDGRVSMKFERGAIATPIIQSVSQIEQIAHRINLRVQDLAQIDGESLLTQSDITIESDRVMIGSQSIGSETLASIISVSPSAIDLLVDNIGEQGEFISQTGVYIDNDRIKIGSTYVDGSDLGSMISVSPSAIKVIADEMRLTGDLLVKGDVEAYAMSAVEAEFGSLWADEFNAITIHADDIEGLTARFNWLYTLNANIERLVSQSVFTNAVQAESIKAIEGEFGSLFSAEFEAITITGEHIESNTIEVKHLTGYDAILESLMARTVFSDEVNALVGNFVDINAGNIVTSGLSANIIKSSHIEASTTLIDKLFASSARIDELITKNHFVDNVKALTIEAVEADIAWLRGELFEANIIEANWLKSGNALIDKVFSSNAMFERMMAKDGFVRTLNTVTIDTDQITIRRPDGGVLVSQGMQLFGSPIITKPYMETNFVTFDGRNYVTSSRGARIFERAYSEHSGRYANFSFNVDLRYDSAHTSAMVGIAIRPGTMPNGVYVPITYESVRAYRNQGSVGVNIAVRLPVPTFHAMSWTLDFWVDHTVDGRDYAQIRTNRCWISS